MAERLVHRDVIGEGAGAFLDRHIAGEAAGRVRSRVFLVGELVEAQGEGDVVADTAQRDLVGLPAVLEFLGVEILGQLEVHDPDAGGLGALEELDDRHRYVGVIVIVAFRLRLVGQFRAGSDALGRLDREAVGHLRLGAQHRVRVIGEDLEREG